MAIINACSPGDITGYVSRTVDVVLQDEVTENGFLYSRRASGLSRDNRGQEPEAALNVAAVETMPSGYTAPLLRYASRGSR